MALPVFQCAAESSGSLLPVYSVRRSRSRFRSASLALAIPCLLVVTASSVASWLFVCHAKAYMYSGDLDVHGGMYPSKGPVHAAGGQDVNFVYRELSPMFTKGVALVAPVAITTVLSRMRSTSSACFAGCTDGLEAVYDGLDKRLQLLTTACKAGLEGKRKSNSNVDLYLVFCFVVWYFGNYQHNICNKLALMRSGGADGFPLTIAVCQLGVGSAYAFFLWCAPDARQKPTMTFGDWIRTLPVSAAAAAAHAGSVFALSAGALSFGQIVKAAEPAFAAGVGTFLYGSKVSFYRVLCLLPIIGGVALSSLAELDFTWAALAAASIANFAAAVRGNENKRLFSSQDLKERLGSVGNQFAITTINAMFFLIPVALYREGDKLGAFWKLLQSDSGFAWNVVLSGWWFYIYNEVATVIIEKTGPLTQSVANTAKRAIVIVLGAMVLGESLNAMKLVGCTIAIGGVFLYSDIEKIMARFPSVHANA